MKKNKHSLKISRSFFGDTTLDVSHFMIISELN